MRVLLLTSSLFLLTLLGCAGTRDMTMPQGHAPEVSKHYDQSMAEWTGSRLFSIEMVIPGEELRMGVNSLEVIVHDNKNKDVPGAEVSITPWMPEMGHGVTAKAEVTERGGGLYSVDNVVLSMVGHWQLKVKVAKAGVEDEAIFDFPQVKAMGHEHAAMHAAAPSDLDTSTKQVSENNLFQVSYGSMRGTIPTNRIHSWTLHVETADGRPVDNARITIVGDMPEHGHGLPTEPEIVKGIGSGNYRVDGVKFQMPGWWVVTFHIMAGEIMDSVTFNLRLR